MFNVVLQNGGAAVSILRFYFSTTHKNTATGSKGFIMHDNCLIFIYIYIKQIPVLCCKKLQNILVSDHVTLLQSSPVSSLNTYRAVARNWPINTLKNGSLPPRL